MPHSGNPLYFKETIPGGWSVEDYVKFQVEHSEKTPRQISDGWHRSLRAIANCEDGCCTQDEIDQANVHHGRWKNKKTADRKYLSQWLEKEEAKKKKAKNINSFHIGSVGTLFAGPVNSVYNTGEGASSSAPVAATMSSGDIPEGLQAVAPAAGEELGAAIVVLKGDIDFQLLLDNFKSTYKKMKTKTLISPGKYLETEVYNTVMGKVVDGFREMSQLFLWVINPDDPIVVEWFPKLLKWIKDMIMPMPAVDPAVIYAISRFSSDHLNLRNQRLALV
ncbi:hypothetical protein P167DRAFT_432316 [Morchella conica CCBAS932]|uniref:Uncharacterized protein n=1 Tax=Morchella conica CCBAS932 TaxID=1392247 RepID=A0A3N4LBU0_9PEZI|nr:hypothetical protein P167DRAFT_432316 [Morchella conica CCBAS932]